MKNTISPSKDKTIQISNIKVKKLDKQTTLNKKLNKSDILNTFSQDEIDYDLKKTISNRKASIISQQEKCFEINTRLINDLEAMYFEDKVKGRSDSNCPVTIPKLNFDFNQPEKKSKKK